MKAFRRRVYGITIGLSYCPWNKFFLLSAAEFVCIIAVLLRQSMEHTPVAYATFFHPSVH